MTKYIVEVTEILKKEVEVIAESADRAEEKALDMHWRGEIELSQRIDYWDADAKATKTLYKVKEC